MPSIVRLAIVAGIVMLATPSSAGAALRVVTTTEDLASLAREVGGDRVEVTALSKGYQDPHFVDPKPSFILAVSRAAGAPYAERMLALPDFLSGGVTAADHDSLYEEPSAGSAVRRTFMTE